VGVPAAVAAGFVSFLSPCVLPLVPGYLSAVVGVAPADLERAGARRVLGPSLLFVASFSAIFILLGLASTAIGSSLNAHRQTLEKVAAGAIIAMGVFFLLTAYVTRLNREWHVTGLIRRAGRGGPVVAGAAFDVAAPEPPPADSTIKPMPMPTDQAMPGKMAERPASASGAKQHGKADGAQIDTMIARIDAALGHDGQLL